MVTESQAEATYHCGIGGLLRAAYERDFSMLEMGKCKTKFPKYSQWYETLSLQQRRRVDDLLKAEYERDL